LASRLNDQLYDLSTNLSTMIREMNDLTGKSSTESLSAEGSDPLASVTQILSAHVSSLGWINENTENLTTKVSELEKRVGNQSLGQSTGLRQSLAGSRRR
jgi:nuclear pore complex protein Nup62